MTNNLALPLLALVLAVLAFCFPFRRGDQPPPSLLEGLKENLSGSILAAIVVALFFAATFLWPSTFPSGTTIAAALAIGVGIGIVSAAANDERRGFIFGLAVFGGSLLHFLPKASTDSTPVAFVTGVFVAAFAIGGVRPNNFGGFVAILASLLIVATDYLGKLATPAGSGSEPAAYSGVVLGLAFLIAALLSGLAASFSKSPVLRHAVGLLALLGIGYLGCSKYLNNSQLAYLWMGGVLVGSIVHLLLAGESEPEPFRFVLATIIWVGAATVAFGVNHQAYGMAVALIGGAGALVLVGSGRGLMSIGVAAAILTYRLFRELFPEDAKAPDIGQHYTMVGIALGALLPLLPLEWARTRSVSSWRSFASGAVWLLILLGLPVASAVLLGSKGAVGMVIGLSFAAVVEGLRGSVSLASVGIATGMGSVTVLTYGWLGDWTDLERAVKIRAVIIVAITALLLSAALFGLSRKQSEEVERS